MTGAGVEGWTVRPGRFEDIDAVLALEREIAEAPHWSREDYLAIFTEPVPASGVRRRLFVAASEGELLGFSVGSVLTAAEDRSGATADVKGELESVAVAPEARKRGLGRALCAAVMAWCREQDADRVELEVRAVNMSAIGIYGGLGFEVVGLRRGYYSDPADDAILMRVLFRSGGLLEEPR